MSDNDRPYRANTAEGQGAGFVAAREGGLAKLTLLTRAGEAELHAKTAKEATWTGATIVIELSYCAELADAIIAAVFCSSGNLQKPHDRCVPTLRDRVCINWRLLTMRHSRYSQ